MKLAPVRIGRQAVIAAATGVLLLAAPIAGTADTGQAPTAPKPGASAEARTAAPSGLAAAGVNCDGGNHCLFFYNVNSSKKQYFDSVDHFNGDRFSGGNGHGNGVAVDNNSWAASNSSTGNRESHWYENPYHGGAHFCVNPGRTVHSLPAVGWGNRISSLRLRPRTSERCLEN